MGQKGEVRKQRPATGWAGRGGCKCTKNSVSSGQDTKVATGRGQGSRVTPPQRGQAPPSGSSVFENKNRTRNSVCLVAGAPPTPTAMPKSVHPVPSKYSNSNQHPFVKKDKQEKKRKAQLLPALPVCTVRSSGPEHGGLFYSPDCSHPVGGASPPWPGPLPSQQESCQETVGAEGQGPSGWPRGLEKRQPSRNSVHAGSQRWSLLGDSRLGALGPLAQCVVLASRARAKRTPASPRPARTPRPMWKR